MGRLDHGPRPAVSVRVEVRAHDSVPNGVRAHHGPRDRGDPCSHTQEEEEGYAATPPRPNVLLRGHPPLSAVLAVPESVLRSLPVSDGLRAPSERGPQGGPPRSAGSVPGSDGFSPSFPVLRLAANRGTARTPKFGKPKTRRRGGAEQTRGRGRRVLARDRPRVPRPFRPFVRRARESEAAAP